MTHEWNEATLLTFTQRQAYQKQNNLRQRDMQDGRNLPRLALTPGQTYKLPFTLGNALLWPMESMAGKSIDANKRKKTKAI